MMKHVHAALLGIAASGVIAGQTSRTVPASLLDAAKHSPVEFAMALTHASIPAGLEIRESDNVMPSRPPAFALGQNERVSLADLITTFNAHHRDYRAVVMPDGVTVIRPVVGTLPFLGEPSSIAKALATTGAMAAARRVFAAVDPTLTGPVLNSIGRKGDEIPLTLDGSGGRRVIDTLNQIVVQAPGRAWLVSTRQEQSAVQLVSFGFIEADGSRRTQAIRAADR